MRSAGSSIVHRPNAHRLNARRPTARQETRLTQAQGTNKDPTWSPDCRMLAFHSSRSGGGIYVSNPSGFNQRRVLDGHAETIRWSPRRSP